MLPPGTRPPALRLLLAALTVAVAVLLLVPGASAAGPYPTPDHGGLRGWVRDAGTGRPVTGATVQARIVVNNLTRYYVARTDSVGFYSLVLPKGTYRVTAAKSGYRGTSQSATVVAGADSYLSFSLCPASDLSPCTT
jgi:hypothetical protein